MTFLHQVSYLRLRDELGVCLSYCCLSGTTCTLCACRSPIYFNIIHFGNTRTAAVLLCWFKGSEMVAVTGQAAFNGVSGG